MDSRKDAIRRSLRNRRRAVTPDEMRAAAGALREHLKTFAPLIGADAVVAYAATDGEMPAQPVLELAHELGKPLYLPRVEHGKLVFAEHQRNAPLRPGPFRIPEPIGPPLIANRYRRLVAFVPLVGWDATGARLGRGGGFYDRGLKNMRGRATFVGLGYAWQECAALPQDRWDIHLDFVVTECGVLRCSAGDLPAHMGKEDHDSHEQSVDDNSRGRGIGGGSGLAAGLPATTAESGAGPRHAGDR